MNPDQPKSEAEIQVERNREIVSLARELSESGEVFPFTGIDPEAYLRIKASDDEYPGMTTPIDEIIRRCQVAGVKVVLGKNPDSGNVFILPARSENLEDDCLIPKTLQVVEGMDSRVRELILKDRTRFQ